MDSKKLYSLLARVSKPSQYLGNEINVIKKDFEKARVRVCLIFPDKYEMGMSHIGQKILYDILNAIPDVVAERCFAPDLDLDAALREEGLPLFSLESKRPLADFDLLGFSFTYELTYTNFLSILDLAGIPLWQRDRKEGHPIILGGGGCMMNAEPLADFLDAGALGDGEELVLDVVNAIRAWKDRLDEPTADGTRHHLLHDLSAIEGIYIPSFFEPEYNSDGTLRRMIPLKKDYERVNKRVLQKLDQAAFPVNPIVPSVKLIHDRIGIEIQRGCNRACRFCQAGYIDRPVRQRSPENILSIAEESLKNTGIGEISLLSLSAADYACLVPLLKELNGRYASEKVAISVPATRTEKLSPELLEQIKRVRKSGFTVAPEAGSPRMRRVINKGNEAADLYQAVTNAFSAGWNLLKLYYMVGLPFERDEDVVGIANEANESIKICKRYTQRAELNLSASSFVPKPHTPFQWHPQMTIAETKEKYSLVRRSLQDRRIHFKHHHPEMSYIEGILSRGDRRAAELLLLAYQEGCRFDEWDEHFSFAKWQAAIAKWDGDPAFYLHRVRTRHEVLPWDHLFAQMDKNFLWDEWEKAMEAGGVTKEEADLLNRRRLKPTLSHYEGFTEDCSLERCSDCGVCDFKVVKNRVYVVGEEEIIAKKANREWYGWNGVSQRPAIVPIQQEGEAVPARLRVRFSKTDEGALMGHLELMGVLKRAFKRCGFPVSYSEGFKPAIKLAMGHPLPVGIESDWEFFDLDLYRQPDPQAFVTALNGALPQGIKILSAELIDRQIPSLYSRLHQSTYAATWIDGDAIWPGSWREKLAAYEQTDIFPWRREQSGKIKEFNLKETVTLNPSYYPEAIVFNTLTLPEGTVKPREVIQAVLGLDESQMKKVCFKKIAVQWKERLSSNRTQDNLPSEKQEVLV